VTSARIISEKFTGFDAWPFGSRRLCVPCAWAYSRQPTSQPALLITATTSTAYKAQTALKASSRPNITGASQGPKRVDPRHFSGLREVQMCTQ
jgi:hypothetical protein